MAASPPIQRDIDSVRLDACSAPARLSEPASVRPSLRGIVRRPTMEQLHGVDVSWMTRGCPRDKIGKPPSPRPCSPSRTSPPSRAESPQSLSPRSESPISQPRSVPTPPPSARGSEGTTATTLENHVDQVAAGASPSSKRHPRSAADKQTVSGASPLSSRRNSWFSNISAKFSSNLPSGNTSSHHHSSHPKELQSRQNDETQQGQPQQRPPSPPSEAQVPRPHITKNAVLQHASRPEGNGPYTPAPPRSAQAGILGVFKRLSSSAASGVGVKSGNGLVDRMTLNVDPTRSRCQISELKDAKLRRVSFCVDVEIAPMPKYAESGVTQRPIDPAVRNRLTEKGEGEALKNGAGIVSKESEMAGEDGADATPPRVPGNEKEGTRKKEKKKKSEEERKARKEKRRRLAEDNGSVPMEIHYDSTGSSSDGPEGTVTPSGTKTTSQPTTNPTRIYRRCCQLRETPILKKITEQLTDSANSCSETGIVHKLDLTDYWLQLADLVTLGDFLAVVPVREIVLENSGLGDEGLRVVLAGLLAAKQPSSSRRKKSGPAVDDAGGVVEHVVLKNNKLGVDGWKHLSLFVYKCRSLKYFDISHIVFPRQAVAKKQEGEGLVKQRGISDIFAEAMAHRLGGSTLEMVNMSGTEPSMKQLSTIMNGIVECGVRRLGLAHNRLDGQGVALAARYLAAGKCEGLDLGGNDLRHHMEVIAGALAPGHPLWALSLAGCNLDHSSLGQVIPALVKLACFRFIDLSDNHDLFQSTPSAVGLLRRYLPKMDCLKRIHLQDVNMTAEQAIAIVEVLPEARTLAHINLLGNTALVKLASANTEEALEEACALYASLLAASRVSESLICVDIEVPQDEAGEIVKAMAKQVVAYCLRNMGRIPDTSISAAAAAAMAETQMEVREGKLPAFPDVVAHLVAQDDDDNDDATAADETNPAATDNDSAPDEDYVIGGTGVVKALRCCLENRGSESGPQSGNERATQPSLADGGKAKDMSKHLLAGARKIRLRLQPALNRARADRSDELNLRKLTFLDETLQGIIKRFEDEFPDTRESGPADTQTQTTDGAEKTTKEVKTVEATTATEDDERAALSPQTAVSSPVTASDGEFDSEIQLPKTASTSSASILLSKVLDEEEGRVLRAGHRLRLGFVRPEKLESVLQTIDAISADPKQSQMLMELAEDLGGQLLEKVREKERPRVVGGLCRVAAEGQGQHQRNDSGGYGGYGEAAARGRYGQGRGP
ncbi:hypothetical protein XA68_15259 [Ophiocordyceps unilateralis]|uniref:Cell wall biogenesis protein Mhp1 n=1 Tax=Ophiocordyceps unilateralis TaxID=268505 RepID=A0A2A9P776_OPHUN|nr:hypothetical protein XA68_15259 [Ophiocordyceps unilateralis]